MSKKYVMLSGDSISRLAESVRQPKRTDLFLISQQALSNVSPDRTYECNGRTYVNGYRSLNLNYGDLSANVFRDITAYFGLKSMAWELSSGYSLYGHIHNYSTVSVKPSIVPTAEQKKTGEVSSLAMFQVDTQKHYVYMDRIRMYDMPKPYLGQLKFVARKDPPRIPNTAEFYGSSDFTGWVYPDGRELESSMFPDAYAFFGDSYGSAAAGKFRIPNMTEFVKPHFPDQEMSQQLTGVVPSQEVLLAHSHVIDSLSLSGKINGTLSVEHVDDNTWGRPAGQHGGDPTSKSQKYKFKAAFDCTGLTCDQKDIGEAGDDKESYPSHVLTPVLMYIGGV